MARQPLRRNLARSRQDGERDRQVEPGALLPQLRRSEIDRDPPVRPDELGRGDPAPDALLRLLAGAVGQPDDRERRDAELQVSLDLDSARIEADESVRDRAREHEPDASRKPATKLSRKRANFVKPVHREADKARRTATPPWSGGSRRLAPPNADGVQRRFEIMIQPDPTSAESRQSEPDRARGTAGKRQTGRSRTLHRLGLHRARALRAALDLRRHRRRRIDPCRSARARRCGLHVRGRRLCHLRGQVIEGQVETTAAAHWRPTRSRLASRSPAGRIRAATASRSTSTAETRAGTALYRTAHTDSVRPPPPPRPAGKR